MKINMKRVICVRIRSDYTLIETVEKVLEREERVKKEGERRSASDAVLIVGPT
jgi:hypothetical protein